MRARLGKSALLVLLLAGSLLAQATVATAQEAAQRLLIEAERAEQDGNTSSALTDYEMVSRQFPGTEVAAQALGRMVEIKRAQGDVDGATAACNRLIDDFPGTNHAAMGMFYSGDLQLGRARKPADAQAVRETFRRVWVLFDPVTHPDLIYRAAARVRHAELEIRAGDIAGAELSYLSTLEAEPMSEWTMRARLGLAGIYLERANWVLAAEMLQQAINEATILGFTDVAADARSHLTLVHRLMLRPAANGKRWQTGSTVGGLNLNKPAGIAASGDGRLVATEELGRSVLFEDGKNVLQRSYDFAYRPFFSRDGKAWVPTGTVIWEMVDRERMTYMGPSRQPTRAILSGAEGIYQWFTIEEKPQRVLTHRAESRVDRQIPASDPVDIATDGQGRLHILDAQKRGVVRYSPAGDASTNLISGVLARPIALDVDPMGNIYVLDRDGQVDIFDSKGQKIETLGPSFPGGITLTSAHDIAVDDTGRIYLLNSKPGSVYVLE
jgi:outer membrane protein assembly factor BamD (BamD/ComL family)